MNRWAGRLGGLRGGRTADGRRACGRPRGRAAGGRAAGERAGGGRRREKRPGGVRGSKETERQQEKREDGNCGARSHPTPHIDPCAASATPTSGRGLQEQCGDDPCHGEDNHGDVNHEDVGEDRADVLENARQRERLADPAGALRCPPPINHGNTNRTRETDASLQDRLSGTYARAVVHADNSRELAGCLANLPKLCLRRSRNHMIALSSGNFGNVRCALKEEVETKLLTNAKYIRACLGLGTKCLETKPPMLMCSIPLLDTNGRTPKLEYISCLANVQDPTSLRKGAMYESNSSRRCPRRTWDRI